MPQSPGHTNFKNSQICTCRLHRFNWPHLVDSFLVARCPEHHAAVEAMHRPAAWQMAAIRRRTEYCRERFWPQPSRPAVIHSGSQPYHPQASGTRPTALHCHSQHDQSEYPAVSLARLCHRSSAVGLGHREDDHRRLSRACRRAISSLSRAGFCGSPGVMHRSRTGPRRRGTGAPVPTAPRPSGCRRERSCMAADGWSARAPGRGTPPRGR